MATEIEMEELKFLKESQVYAIAPYYLGGYSSVLITEKGKLLSKKSVHEIMNRFCIMNGSTLDGCIRATRETTSCVKNPPIMLSAKGLYAMQLPSYEYKEAVWIFNLNILTQKIANGPMKIVFQNNHYVEIDASVEKLQRYLWKLLEMKHLFNQIAPDYLK